VLPTPRDHAGADRRRIPVENGLSRSLGLVQRFRLRSLEVSKPISIDHESFIIIRFIETIGNGPLAPKLLSRRLLRPMTIHCDELSFTFQVVDSFSSDSKVYIFNDAFLLR